MSQIELNIITTEGAFSGEVHRSEDKAIVAALTVTIDEGAPALGRFV